MNRNSSVTAMVLTSHQAGEDNRSITVLSPEKGIFNAILYGGRKSRLRSLVSPYHSGRMWIYTDETKKLIKITDFDVTEYRTELRDNLYKTWAAALCAELAVKTSCGSECQKTWTTVKGFLDGLCLVDEKQSRIGLLRFLWRWLNMLGLQPDAGRCCLCHKDFFPSHIPVQDYDVTMQCVLSPHDCGFVCTSCSGAHSSSFSLSMEGLFYLYALSHLSPSEVRKLPLSEKAAGQLQDILFYLISSAAEGKLKTLQTGSGILF